MTTDPTDRPVHSWSIADDAAHDCPDCKGSGIRATVRRGLMISEPCGCTR